RRGDVVGISLPRGADTVVAVLATWKAGAAYLPLDPAYPARRLADMVEDARPAALVTADYQPEPPLPAVRLPDAWPALDALAPDALGPADLSLSVGPDDRAYVIFTSGSTGRPKGVVLYHRGLCNMSEAQRVAFGFGPGDRVLQFASLCFDASVFEIAMALRVG